MKNLIIENMKKRKSIVSMNDYDLKILDDQSLEIIMESGENTLNPLGLVHGGIIYTLMDNCSGSLAVINGKKTVTLNSSVNFIRAAKTSFLRGIAKIIHKGSTTIVMGVKVFDDKEHLLANGSFTMYILGELKPEDFV